jgi:hypothetical protein
MVENILKGVNSRFIKNKMLNGESIKRMRNDPPMAAYSSIDARLFLPDSEKSPAF